MQLFTIMPGLVWPLLAYLAIVYLGGGTHTLYSVLFEVPLFSGVAMKVTVNGLLVIAALVLLFFEVLKSTRISTVAIVDHMMSTFVFIGYLIAFLLIPACGNQFFLMLLIMALIDVLAGFTVTITAARRDIGIDKQSI